jgi:tRNA-dihydrouridine synthase
VFPRSYQVGPIAIAPATVLAPMAGVTDTVFRRMIRHQGGCGLIARRGGGGQVGPIE